MYSTENLIAELLAARNDLNNSTPVVEITNQIIEDVIDALVRYFEIQSTLSK